MEHQRYAIGGSGNSHCQWTAGCPCGRISRGHIGGSNDAVRTIGLWTNLVLLYRVHPFVSVMLKGSETRIASSIKEHKRVRQNSKDGEHREIGDDGMRVVRA